jgi:myo-inositol-1(or 4)-monophosphatase
MTPPPIQLAELRAILEGAGRIVCRHYEVPGTSTPKGDGSPLTAADVETNQFLRDHLLALLPEAGWLSEESRDNPDRLDCEWVWVVDPLDGTKEFVKRIPELAVSIGLVRRGEVILGGVFNPVRGEGAIGVTGEGLQSWGLAHRGSAPATRLEEAAASVSRTELEDDSIRPWLGLVREARTVGSVAYKLLRVAVGQDDLTFSVAPKSEWDICGGVALLRATGMIYERLDRKPSRFNQLDPRIRCGAVAGPVPLTRELCGHLTQAGRSMEIRSV